MTEILTTSINRDLAIMADPNVSDRLKRYATLDLMISRRMIQKGVDVLPDAPTPTNRGSLKEFEERLSSGKMRSDEVWEIVTPNQDDSVYQEWLNYPT